MFFIVRQLGHVANSGFQKNRKNEVEKLIVQIYEIQSPRAAREVLRLGVDHVGSVIPDRKQRRDPEIKATIETVRAAGARSCLIPLFNGIEDLRDTIAYYRPDIIHFCDILTPELHSAAFAALIERQAAVRKWFPTIQIMRSIPIGTPASSASIPSLAWAARFEPWTDWFLTDTLLNSTDTGTTEECQPVQGFVGITGCVCDWKIARALVAQSRLPVILAGGLSPNNVAQAVTMVRPAGVDSCTRTNAIDQAGRPIRFRKDLDRVAAFIKAARQPVAQENLLITS